MDSFLFLVSGWKVVTDVSSSGVVLAYDWIVQKRLSLSVSFLILVGGGRASAWAVFTPSLTS